MEDCLHPLFTHSRQGVVAVPKDGTQGWYPGMVDRLKKMLYTHKWQIHIGYMY